MLTADQQNMQNAMYDIAMRKLEDLDNIVHNLSLDIECTDMSVETRQALQTVCKQLYQLLYPGTTPGK